MELAIASKYWVQAQLLAGLGSEKIVNLEPVHKGFKPSIARSIRIPKAEPVATGLVKVKLDWPARFKPRFDDTKLAAEKKIISRDHIEHRG
ncbi:MAG TPA: hypothetical protein VFU05_09855, partial [Cyclobacteriaceae bacterium]|nr:hypothetical protein [Cyclobacteriaceae bacterium]